MPLSTLAMYVQCYLYLLDKLNLKTFSFLMCNEGTTTLIAAQSNMKACIQGNIQVK